MKNYAKVRLLYDIQNVSFKNVGGQIQVTNATFSSKIRKILKVCENRVFSLVFCLFCSVPT
jgi:hypothetical protein